MDFFELQPEDFVQELSYRFGVTYQPGGGIFASSDDGNQQIIVAAHSLQATIQIAYSLSPAWTVDAFGSAGISRTSHYQAAAAGSAKKEWQASFKAGAGLEHAFVSGGPLKPAVYLRSLLPNTQA